jgi:hypothetical protein
MKIGEIVGVLQRGKPAGGDALPMLVQVLAQVLALRHGDVPHYDFGKMLARPEFLSIGQNFDKYLIFIAKNMIKTVMLLPLANVAILSHSCATS